MTAAAIRPEALVWAGLLPVDKPTGMTSHDVVARARRVLRTRAIGHLGTLDPGASGLLVLAIGPATRCVSVWQGGVKTYAATLRLGLVTDSQDLQGKVLETREVATDEAALRLAAAALVGDHMQLPPMVSALKHKGERLYDIARRGETVERELRPIHVAAWEWTDIALPDASFVVRCSGGTYVRTLAHDLGSALGCGAALAQLRRLASAPFGIEQACPWDLLMAGDAQQVLERHGVPLHDALSVLPAVTLDDAQADALGHGCGVLVTPGNAPVGAGARTVVLRDGAGRALALGELRDAADGRSLACPNVVFPWAVREGRAA